MKALLSSVLFLLIGLSNCAAQKPFQPKDERMQGDFFLGVKAGAMYTNLTDIKGEPKITPTGGVFGEIYLSEHFAGSAEFTFSHQGSHRADQLNDPANKDQLDYRLNFLNTDFLLKYYPGKHFTIYTGIRTTTIITAECNYKNIRPQLHRADFTVPVGFSFMLHNFIIDARGCPPIRRITRSQEARAIMGNAKTYSGIVTLGYRFQLF